MSAKPFSWSLWGWPVAIGVVSAFGLMSALLGDGPWDWASWAALGLPAALGCWHGIRRRRVHTPQER